MDRRSFIFAIAAGGSAAASASLPLEPQRPAAAGRKVPGDDLPQTARRGRRSGVDLDRLPVMRSGLFSPF